MAVGFGRIVLFFVQVLNMFEVDGKFNSPRSRTEYLWSNRQQVLHNIVFRRRNAYLLSTSLERLQEYMVIEQEPKPNQGGLPPAHWPSSGDLRVEKLSARYSPVSSGSFLHGLVWSIFIRRMDQWSCMISPSISSLVNGSASSAGQAAARARWRSHFSDVSSRTERYSTTDCQPQLSILMLFGVKWRSYHKSYGVPFLIPALK